MKGPSPRSRVHLIQHSVDGVEKDIIPPSKIIEAASSKKNKAKPVCISVASENSESTNAVISIEDHDDVVEKMKKEIEFLCGLLGKAKDERDINMKEISLLRQSLKESNDIIEKLTAKTTYEEDAFVTALTDERTFFDKKFSSVNVKNQARTALLVEWAAAGSAISILQPDLVLQDLLMRTCAEVPKAREESARIFKSYLSAPHAMQKAVEDERESRKVERSVELEKTLQSEKESVGNTFSTAIKNAKLKAVVETEQEVSDSRDASSAFNKTSTLSTNPFGDLLEFEYDDGYVHHSNIQGPKPRVTKLRSQVKGKNRRLKSGSESESGSDSDASVHFKSKFKDASKTEVYLKTDKTTRIADNKHSDFDSETEMAMRLKSKSKQGSKNQVETSVAINKVLQPEVKKKTWWDYLEANAGVDKEDFEDCDDDDFDEAQSN